MTVYLDPALSNALWPMVLWSGFVGVILAAVLILDRDWQTVPAWLVRRLVIVGLMVGIATRLWAFDLFLNCDWDALVDYYGYAGAWAYWIWAGC